MEPHVRTQVSHSTTFSPVVWLTLAKGLSRKRLWLCLAGDLRNHKLITLLWELSSRDRASVPCTAKYQILPNCQSLGIVWRVSGLSLGVSSYGLQGAPWEMMWETCCYSTLPWYHCRGQTWDETRDAQLQVKLVLDSYIQLLRLPQAERTVKPRRVNPSSWQINLPKTGRGKLEMICRRLGKLDSKATCNKLS